MLTLSTHAVKISCMDRSVHPRARKKSAKPYHHGDLRRALLDELLASLPEESLRLDILDPIHNSILSEVINNSIHALANGSIRTTASIYTEFVRYPGESHGEFVNGKPAHYVDRIERVLAWFDKYTAANRRGSN